MHGILLGRVTLQHTPIPARSRIGERVAMECIAFKDDGLFAEAVQACSMVHLSLEFTAKCIACYKARCTVLMLTRAIIQFIVCRLPDNFCG